MRRVAKMATSLVTTTTSDNSRKLELNILKHFRKELWEATERFVVLSGGAGSGKSYAICQRICYMFMSMEDIQFAVIRATMPALKKTVYMGDPSIVRMLSEWGIPMDIWLNKTDAVITNPHNKSQITFIGLADPERIKSANLNYIWIEEATELNVTKWRQLDTRMRRYNPYGPNQMYISYNPISYYNWAVQTFVMSPGGLEDEIVVNFSNFKNNPYVNMRDVNSWLHSAEVDESYYRTYVTGEPGMPLGQVYPNIKFAPHQMWSNEVWMQRPYYGIDWGFIDPMVLVECRNYGGRVYIRCLYYKTRRDADDLIAFMKRHKIPLDSEIYCDPSSPERINRLVDAGYDGAMKAHRDINAGISHMRTKDIIASNSGSNGEMFTIEVAGYSYETDPDDSSKFIEKPEEGNEHILDASRYGVVTHDRYSEFAVGPLDLPTVDDMLLDFEKKEEDIKEFDGDL